MKTALVKILCMQLDLILLKINKYLLTPDNLEHENVAEYVINFFNDMKDTYIKY